MPEPDNPQNQPDQQQNNELSAQVLKPDAVVDPAANASQPQQVPFFKRFFTIKKVVAIFGVIILLLVVVLAISRFGDDSITPAKGDGEVVWWTVQEDPETIRPIVDEFERQNPNVSVVIKPQSETDYVERLRNVLTSNNPPEIFEIHKSWVPMFRAQTYPLPKTIMTTDELKQDFYSVITTNLVGEDGLMAMPLYYDAITMYVNQDIFTQAATSPPETWMELEEMVSGFNQKGRNGILIQTGVPMGSPDVDYWQEVVALLMYQNGANLSQPEGKRANAALNFYSSFRNKGVWDNRLPPSTEFFAQGNAAMYFGPTLEASNIIRLNPDLRFRTMPLPQIPKGDPSDPDFSYTTYYAHSVSAGSGDRDSAWKLLKYLTESEQLMQLNQNRESKGLYPRIYPRSSMANLQNADSILGSAVALIPQAKGWYLNDDQIEGNTSLTDQVSDAYSKSVFGDTQLKGLSRSLREVLSKFGIRV